jgi:hypothetical protein
MYIIETLRVTFLPTVLYFFLTSREFQNKSDLGINICAAPHIIAVIKLRSKNEWGFRVLQAGADVKFQGKNPLGELTLTLDDTSI